MIDDKVLLSQIWEINAYRMMLGNVCTLYTQYCRAFYTYAIYMYLHLCLLLYVQDEMNEEHEKELQELKVDNSI